MADLAWLKSLQGKVWDLLAPLVPEAERASYVDEKAMRVWVRAFTHETFDLDNNYEELEFAGDAILKAVFPLYLMERFPSLGQSQLTELGVIYMSKVEQANMSIELGLGPLVRVALERANFNINGDVFESFFGALREVGDMVMKEKTAKPESWGLGMVLCRDMIIALFREKKIDTAVEGSPKTVVPQIFTRFGLSVPQTEARTERNGSHTVAVYLSPDQAKFLANYGIAFQGDFLGSSNGNTKTEAEHGAYRAALEALKSVGISPAWARKEKAARDLSAPGVKELYGPALAKAKREGLDGMEFFSSRKTSTKDKSLLQLVGVREGPTTTHRVLASKFVLRTQEADFPAEHAALLRQYLEKK